MPSTSDHPRSRGVYGWRVEDIGGKGGSSPLARGLPPVGSGLVDEEGIIPARAGFTREIVGLPEYGLDHPRSRGVYWTDDGNSHYGPGSSPLARGLPQAAAAEQPQDGIIPARAGFTGTRTFSPRPCRDHPRSRGVYSGPTEP